MRMMTLTVARSVTPTDLTPRRHQHAPRRRTLRLPRANPLRLHVVRHRMQ
ncbi:MAG: hypothetical protein IE926_03375 [Micrococcales bacterium]|nr:hypothetical protein [Phycicoccus sp.]MBD3781988.1 hypothetical protein [Micrococcales bacterium]HMM94142.1 hypothetical protein [Phycicoccus sp.]